MGGKGKGKRNREGHLLPRTRITAEKFTGHCSAWKGKYGWITPAEDVEHDKAKNHNGSLFVGFEDLDDGLTELTPGAPCEFHIWEDDSGLGADAVVETGDVDPDFKDPTGKGSGKKGSGKGDSKGKDKGKGKDRGKVTSRSAPWERDQGRSESGSTPPWHKAEFGGRSVRNDSFEKPSKGGGKGKKDESSKGKGKGKGDKGKKGTPKYKLPRTRISAEKFTGTVKAWKGKFGWITPDEPIEHDKASKNRGELFVGFEDIEGATELDEGIAVEFHLFEDDSGLGADEVTVL